MANISLIMNEIELLRENLSNLIQTKGELLDPEVIKASVLLDDALNAYNMLVIKDSNSARRRRVC